jgi:hypothetical protein
VLGGGLLRVGLEGSGGLVGEVLATSLRHGRLD